MKESLYDGQIGVEMQYEVLFVSKTGNTEKLATAVFDAIPGKSKEIQRLTKETELDLAETYFIGFWTNRGTCSFEVLEYISEMHGKNIALFGTCGMGRDAVYYNRIEKQVSALIPDDNQYLGMFMCQGKMPMQVRNKYEEALLHGDNDGFVRTMIRNFDEALLHPNEEDYKNSKKFVEEALLKIGIYQ